MHDARISAARDAILSATSETENLGLTIVVPAYNEEDGIGEVLGDLFDVVGNVARPCEIIVVDDGSQDRTAKIAQDFEDVRVIRHSINKGYGAAVKTGIRHACNELICITDADGTYPNGRIPDLTETLVRNELDMIVGARTGSNVSIPLIRRPAKWAIRKLAEYVSGQPIPDINSGLRVFRRSIALRLLNLLPDGFSLTTTITLGMLANGYLVEYQIIDYHGRIGKSKIRPVRDTMGFTQLVIRMGLYFAPLKVFIPISGLLLTIAAALGLISAFVFGRLADVTTLIVVLAAVQIAAVGMLAELINRRLPNFYREE